MKICHIAMLVLACFLLVPKARCQSDSGIKFPFQKTSDYIVLEGYMRTLKDSLRGKQSSQWVGDAELFTSLLSYLRRQNVFINWDGINLMYTLNAEVLKQSGGRLNWSAAGTRAIAPSYPAADAHVQEVANDEYAISKMPDLASNEKFVGLARQFDSLYQFLPSGTGERRSWTDTIKLFRSFILPAIAKHRDSICKSLMDYYNLGLGSINRMMDSIDHAATVQTNYQNAIRSLIEDFPLPEEMFTAYRYASYPYHAIFATQIFISFAPLSSPANANVFIFKKNADGKARRDPEIGCYEVYYGPNGMTHSLKPGCDTLSFFALHPTSRASNLPIVLGKGNYCFIFKEVSTGKLTMRKDVNLSNEHTYVTDKMVKLCFLVDN